MVTALGTAPFTTTALHPLYTERLPNEDVSRQKLNRREAQCGALISGISQLGLSHFGDHPKYPFVTA